MNRLPIIGLILSVVLISGCTNTPGTEVDLTGKDYAALITLGIPITCDVGSVGNFETDTILYIKGMNARAEVSFDHSDESYNSVSVIKDDRVYVKVVDEYFGGIESECSWIYIETPEDKDDASPSISEDDLRMLDGSEFTCVVGSFGDEKFATPGEACSMADFMKSLIPDLGDIDIDYCEQIEDPDVREQLGCE